MRYLPSAFGLLLMVATSVPGIAQQSRVEGIEVSPVLSELAGRRAKGLSSAEDSLWAAVEAGGTPLVEPAPGVPGHSIVSFVFRGDPAVRSVRLDSNLNALLIERVTPDFESLGTMRRLQGTDVWYLSFRLRNDLRAPYRFEVTREGAMRETVLDPLNPTVWEPDQSALAASVVELSGASPQPWRDARTEEGDWDEWQFEEQPDSGRSVYIYKPRDWDAERPEGYPVLVGLGAYGHGIGMRVDRMVDHLIGTGRLAPLVVALADLEVGSEATRYRSTTEFVADRLLPLLQSRYNVTADPEEVVISGTSRRGMVAALVALRRPGAIGNVLSMSGSFYWRPTGEPEYEWVPRLYAAAGRRRIRFFVAAGELETVVTPRNAGHYLIATNRHFRNVLIAAGYRLIYREFNGVHSELNWQDALADGLARLLGPGS